MKRKRWKRQDAKNAKDRLSPRLLCFRLPVSAHAVLITGEFAQTHRAAGVELSVEMPISAPSAERKSAFLAPPGLSSTMISTNFQSCLTNNPFESQRGMPRWRERQRNLPLSEKVELIGRMIQETRELEAIKKACKLSATFSKDS